MKNLDYELIKNNLSDIKIEVKNTADPTIVIILNGFGGLNDQIINTKTTKKNFIKNLILLIIQTHILIFKMSD